MIHVSWDLQLEYIIGAAAVSRSWTGYLRTMLVRDGAPLPAFFTEIEVPGWPYTFDVLALVLLLLLSAIQASGIGKSARLNMGVVTISVTTLLIFIFGGIPEINPANYTPFMPFGMNGVLAGSAVIFFSYVGFDAVTSTAEELIQHGSVFAVDSTQSPHPRPSRPHLRFQIC
eukprot:TRINITY_DN1466_c2_g1_i1.p1 TRINITY_DN1466_c2_g1~~TRINITY_DN1466_c2_g1_i1.p1  ORF type:complete len:172 (-),score=28.28 TRINITY_DN1466_c2_g1_i1:53-568(-)